MADAGTAKRGDLTQGSIGPTLLKFALPTLASSILQSLNGTINAIWVGRFLGEHALAATSNANMVMFLLTAFVFGFGMASTILIGQYWGRRDVEEARKIFGTAAGAFGIITIIIAIAGWFLSPAILQRARHARRRGAARAGLSARHLPRHAGAAAADAADDGAARGRGQLDAALVHDRRRRPRQRTEPGLHPRPWTRRREWGLPVRRRRP